jgi:hypothetical protein
VGKLDKWVFRRSMSVWLRACKGDEEIERDSYHSQEQKKTCRTNFPRRRRVGRFGVAGRD